MTNTHLIPYLKISDYFFPFPRSEEKTPIRTAKKEAHQNKHYRIIVSALSKFLFNNCELIITDKETKNAIPAVLSEIIPVTKASKNKTKLFFNEYEYKVNDVLFIHEIFFETSSATTKSKLEILKQDLDLNSFFSKSLNLGWFERSVAIYNEGIKAFNNASLFFIVTEK